MVYPILPGLLTEFAPPESGLTVTLTMLNQALAGIEIWFGSMNQALNGLQAAFYGNLDLLAWMGLASLASGCAITLGALLPHYLNYQMYQVLLDYLDGTPWLERLIPAEKILAALRGRKTFTEIDRIRKAGTIASMKRRIVYGVMLLCLAGVVAAQPEGFGRGGNSPPAAARPRRTSPTPQTRIKHALVMKTIVAAALPAAPPPGGPDATGTGAAGAGRNAQGRLAAALRAWGAGVPAR